MSFNPSNSQDILLPSLEEISKVKQDSEELMKQYSSDQIKHLRIKAKNDLFWLSYSVLGYDKLSPHLHKHLCGWLHITDNCQFRAILLPRSHYKSTIKTISDSIRICLTDDTKTSPYPRNLGPNCRLLIGHEVHESAGLFLNSITQHFLSNKLLIGLFPELTPDPRIHKINKYELELPRTNIWSEPTIDTVGVGGRRQGRHYNFINLDDITGPEARDSKTVNAGTKLWFDNIQSFLITPLTDHIDIEGTRWAFDDVYQHAFDVYGDKLVKYIRACLEKNPKTGELETIFPEQFSLESVKILMKNKVVWNANYANNPKEGGTLFDPAWKRFYQWTLNSRKLLVQSGSIEAGNFESYTRDLLELDRVILVDPAVTGLTGFVVTGTDKRKVTYILEAKKHNWRPPDFIDFLFKSVIRWQPRIVAIESVLFSELYQHWLPTEMSIRGIKFRVIPIKTRQKSKESRVSGLSNYFQAGQLYFNESQIELLEEFDQFGATDNYHMLDALAQGPEVWRAPVDLDRINKNREAEESWMENQDAITGYSSY